MVYDIISDNVVQIGLSILDRTTLDYDIVLKKHIQNITDISIQFDGNPAPPLTVIFTDITTTPNVVLSIFAGIGDTLVHTNTPQAIGSPETCGRIINVTTDLALVNGDNILYVKIMLDKAGD